MGYFVTDVCLISPAALKICHRKLFIYLLSFFLQLSLLGSPQPSLFLTHMLYLHGIFELWCIRYKNDLKLSAAEIKYLMNIRIWCLLVQIYTPYLVNEIHVFGCFLTCSNYYSWHVCDWLFPEWTKHKAASLCLVDAGHTLNSGLVFIN